MVHTPRITDNTSYMTTFRSLLDFYFPTLCEMERWMTWYALDKENFVQNDAAKLLGITKGS